jgi:hypothetical protein
MSKPTGDDERSLHRILDSIRIGSILLLLLHFYLLSYPVAEDSGVILDKLTDAVARLPVVGDRFGGKVLAFLLLGVSLLGANGRKTPEYEASTGIGITLAGVGLFFGSSLFSEAGLLYILFCSAGWLALLYGGNYLSRIIWDKPPADVFNRLHESFPQQEEPITNERSVNLPAFYQYNGAVIPSWVNFVSPQRGTLILGSPGSGKTAYVLQHFVRQMMQKGYAMVLHDFKYDDLSKLAYNYFVQNRQLYPDKAGFFNIQFDDLERCHRCNLLDPAMLNDVMDAEESARALLLGLNMEWIGKQGDFFVESAITLVKALIWFLRRHKNGVYCTWPHVIELAQTPKNLLFPILAKEPEIENLVRPFIEAMEQSAGDQLAGQIATTTLSLSKLTSKRLYYILTGNDFTLDLNDPDAPKVLTLGNNPLNVSTYAPLVSAYMNAVTRMANRKKARKLAVILEEFSTISVHTIDKTIATGRSNDIAVVICLQNINQVKYTYGDRFADIVLNTCGNIISGQNTGETARLLADRFGRTMQDRESLTASYAEVQVTRSQQLEPVIPQSRIATLSPGEFVGIVADTPEQPIEQKIFSCQIEEAFEAENAEAAAFLPLPKVREVSDEMLDANFNRVRAEIKALVKERAQDISQDPEDGF